MELKWNSAWTVPSIVGGVCFGVGVGVGSALTYYRLKKTFEIAEEIVEATEDLVDQFILDFGAVVIDEPVVIEEVFVGAYEGPLDEPTDEVGSATHTLTVDEIPTFNHSLVEPVLEETHSVWEDSDDDWDYEEEMKGRGEIDPFVIHRDEFEDDNVGYTQTTLTYYEGDDILTDEHDQPLYNAAQVAGELKFGHGSQDPNIVYIRNHKYKAEYEILRDSGSYQEVVLGEEIEHSLSKERHVINKLRPQD